MFIYDFPFNFTALYTFDLYLKFMALEKCAVIFCTNYINGHVRPVILNFLFTAKMTSQKVFLIVISQYRRKIRYHPSLLPLTVHEHACEVKWEP